MTMLNATLMVRKSLKTLLISDQPKSATVSGVGLATLSGDFNQRFCNALSLFVF